MDSWSRRRLVGQSEVSMSRPDTRCTSRNVTAMAEGGKIEGSGLGFLWLDRVAVSDVAGDQVYPLDTVGDVT
jgi:hypothetical protein